MGDPTREKVISDMDWDQVVDTSGLRRVGDLNCWLCDGWGWVRNGDIEDGMLTGRDSCWACGGTGRVTEARLEAEIARMRERAWKSSP